MRERGKMIKLYGEIEDKRRETEREHEMAMTRMFMEFMERIDLLSG